ncbi:molybdopterin biosynthesis protein [Nocardia sp. NPDC058379]|uniref:molybdopterin biosynthesis protein n=1 Tax=unclassified Nocardia TaxID=2637762 RepID=UPI00364D74F0
MVGVDGLQQVAAGAAGKMITADPVPECAARISVADLGPAVRRGLRPIAPVTRLLSDAVGATLARPLLAQTAEPSVDTAARDGYAVSGPGPYWVVRAGKVSSTTPALAVGEAARITAGTSTPLCTTAVIRDAHVEFARVLGQAVLMRAAGAPKSDDTRVRGAQWHAGMVLASAGVRVGPAVVSVGSSARVGQASVRGPLSADVLVTSGRLGRGVNRGAQWAPDAVAPVISDFLRACDIRSGKVWQMSDGELLRSWFALPADAEVVVVVGALEEVRFLLAEIAADLLVDGVRMRPGGDQLLARLPDGRTLLAVPADPFEAIAALMVTGRRVLEALTARDPVPPMLGRLVDRCAATADLTEVVPVGQVGGGVWRATGPIGIPHLAHLVEAQALALLPPGGTRGALAELIPLPR